MIRFFLTLSFAFFLSTTAHAEDTLGKIGSAVGKGLQAVGDTIESTAELVEDEESPAETRAKLDRMEDEVITRLLSENDDARNFMDISAGYAAFDMRRLTVFPLSGGYGRGVAVSKDGTERTICNWVLAVSGRLSASGALLRSLLSCLKHPLISNASLRTDTMLLQMRVSWRAKTRPRKPCSLPTARRFLSSARKAGGSTQMRAEQNTGRTLT